MHCSVAVPVSASRSHSIGRVARCWGQKHHGSCRAILCCARARPRSARASGSGHHRNILELVDNELEGVKATVEAFVKLLNDQHYEIAISTFTESEDGCYVSLRTFLSVEDAIKHVRDIELCRPPHNPEVSANGGDSAENMKASLTRWSIWTQCQPSVSSLPTPLRTYSTKGGRKVHRS